MFHSKKLPFLCVRIASIMADLPRGFNDDFSSFARGGSDGVKNTKKQHGLLTSDGQKTVLLCCLVRAWGLEPQRLAAREPKGYVTLVKDFQSPPYRKGRTSFQRFKRYSVMTGRIPAKS